MRYAAIVAFCLVLPFAAPAANVLVNPGFEETCTNWGSAWVGWGSCSVDHWAGEAGSCGVAFWGWEGGSYAGFVQMVAVTSHVGGDACTFSIRGYAEPHFACSNDDLRLVIEFWDASDLRYAVTNNIYAAFVAAGATWNTYSLSHTNTDPTVGSVRPYVHADSFAPTGSQYLAAMWDHASLEVLDLSSDHLLLSGATEGYSSSSNSWTVTRSGSTATSLTVTLVSSAPSVADVESPVVIGVAESSAVVHVSCLAQGSATITASADGYTAADRSIWVVPSRLLLDEPDTVYVGSSNPWTIVRRAPLDADLSVDLQGAPGGVVSMVSPLVISAGSSTAQFHVTGVSSGTTMVTASASGLLSATQWVTVLTRQLTLSGAASVYEGTSNLWVAAREGPVDAELVVDLTSSAPAVASVGSPVTIAIGATTASFHVSGLTAGTSLITAAAADYLPAAQSVVVEGNGLRLTGWDTVAPRRSNLWTVARTGPGTEPASVSLTSADPEVVVIDGSVEMAGGSTSATFWVRGIDVGTATISAACSGYLTATREMKVSPNLLLNPGFEDGYEWEPAWEAWGDLSIEGWAAETGLRGAAFHGWVFNGGAEFLQDVDVGAGPLGPTSVFTFSISARSDPGFATYSRNMSMQMWVSDTPHGWGPDVSNNIYDALVASPGTWNQYSVRLTNTDPNVVSVTVHIWCDWFRQTGELSAVMWDNASLELVPGGMTNLMLDGHRNLCVGTSNMWTVSRSGEASADLLISLSNSPPSIASTPESVLVGAGQTSATFYVTGLATGSATIHARAPGYPRESQGITVLPNRLTLSGTNRVYAGFSNGWYVVRTGPTDNPLPVRLTAGDPAVVGVETQVLISALATSAVFQVTGVAAGSASVTANAAELVPAIRDLTVSPLGLTLDGAMQVYQGLSNLWIATRDGPTDGDLEVTLSSDDPAVASVPPSVIIPSGETTAGFQATGGGPGTTTVRATAFPYPDASRTMVVRGNQLSLNGNPTLVPGESMSWTVGRTGPLDPAITVSITSDCPSVATGDLSTVIGEGLTSASFSVYAVSVGTATVWASAAGYAPASRILIVDDNLLDDPGFEEPDGWGSVWEGWGDASEEIWAAESGQKGVCFQGWWMGGFAGFRQTVPVQPPSGLEGNFYAFTISARADADFRTSNGVVCTLMEFLDESGEVGDAATNRIYDQLVARAGEWNPYTLIAVDTNIFTRYVRVSTFGEEFSPSGGLSAMMWDNADLRVHRLSVTSLFLYGNASASEGQSNLWTVARGGTLQTTLVVALDSDDPSVASVDPAVSIPIGDPSASFYVSVQDEAVKSARVKSRARSKRDGGATAIITATAPYYPQTNKDITATQKILDLGGNSRVGVSMSNRWVVTRTGPMDTALTVDLASTAPDVAAVPSSLGIAAHEASATFSVSGVSTGTAVITASAADYQTDTRDAVVSELVPDLDMPEIADHGITWYASSGLTYRVEEAYGLTGAWFTVHTFLATSDCIRTWRDAYPPGSDKVFYRIFLVDTNAGSSY